MKISNEKLLLLFFVLYLVIQLFLAQNYTMESDEGTHGSISLFFKNLINNLKNFKSFNDITEFAFEYALKYPKITPIYPPLYHVLLTGVFFINESVFLGRILNITITLLTAFVIYKLALELLKDKNSAIVSSVSFLVFSTIFRYAPLLYNDIIQILTFTLVLLYYLKLKKMDNITIKNIIIFSLLLALAFLTKFFSIFLPFIILIDSFFSKRKYFKYVLISLILSLIFISPYIFLYVNFKLYKFALKVATTPFTSRLGYLDIFTNFGVFMGLFVVASTIWFLYANRRNFFILTWFLLPTIIFLTSTHSSIRFAYILMPIFAVSCGFFIKNVLRTRRWKNLLLIGIISLLVLQFIFDVLSNYHDFVYPTEETIKSLGLGSVLILSEEPVYSSVYIFYGQLYNKSNVFIRPCLLNKNNLTHDFLEEWGIKYLIDQNNMIDEKFQSDHGLSLTFSKESDDYTIRIFETDAKKEVNCNYICRLEGKICEDQRFSDLLALINKTY